MHAAALLAEALELARQFDYQIREEYLEGAGGGHCSFAGKKWLLLDVTQSPANNSPTRSTPFAANRARTAATVARAKRPARLTKRAA